MDSSSTDVVYCEREREQQQREQREQREQQQREQREQREQQQREQREQRVIQAKLVSVIYDDDDDDAYLPSAKKFTLMVTNSDGNTTFVNIEITLESFEWSDLDDAIKCITDLGKILDDDNGDGVCRRGKISISPNIIDFRDDDNVIYRVAIKPTHRWFFERRDDSEM